MCPRGMTISPRGVQEKFYYSEAQPVWILSKNNRKGKVYLNILLVLDKLLEIKILINLKSIADFKLINGYRKS